MLLISTKFATFPHAYETKMYQCLPYYLLQTCTFEIHKFGKNQDFEKVKDKHTAHRVMTPAEF